MIQSYLRLAVVLVLFVAISVESACVSGDKFCVGRHQRLQDKYLLNDRVVPVREARSERLDRYLTLTPWRENIISYSNGKDRLFDKRTILIRDLSARENQIQKRNNKTPAHPRSRVFNYKRIDHLSDIEFDTTERRNHSPRIGRVDNLKRNYFSNRDLQLRNEVHSNDYTIERQTRQKAAHRSNSDEITRVRASYLADFTRLIHRQETRLREHFGRTERLERRQTDYPTRFNVNSNLPKSATRQNLNYRHSERITRERYNNRVEDIWEQKSSLNLLDSQDSRRKDSNYVISSRQHDLSKENRVAIRDIELSRADTNIRRADTRVRNVIGRQLPQQLNQHEHHDDMERSDRHVERSDRMVSRRQYTHNAANFRQMKNRTDRRRIDMRTDDASDRQMARRSLNKDTQRSVSRVSINREHTVSNDRRFENRRILVNAENRGTNRLELIRKSERVNDLVRNLERLNIDDVNSRRTINKRDETHEASNNERMFDLIRTSNRREFIHQKNLQPHEARNNERMFDLIRTSNRREFIHQNLQPIRILYGQKTNVESSIIQWQICQALLLGVLIWQVFCRKDDMKMMKGFRNVFRNLVYSRH